MQFGFLLPLPAAAERARFRIAALLQGLQSVALVMLLLDIARQRAEFVRGFNQTLLDAMDTGLVLVGPDRRIVRANRWMTERFGDALGGRTCHETYLDRQEPCVACPWRNGQPAARELSVDGRDGRKLLIHASPLTAPDSSALLLELVSDVTRQEALRMRVLHSERLAAIGEMAARVAHEVRSPLGAIGVHTELAREELMPGGDVTEARAHLDVVTSRINTVASLIESYLEFGRPPKLSPARVDLDDVIDAHLARLGTDLGDRRISVHRARGDVPPVMADTDQLGQVLVNLLKNAIEAMPQGGTLTISTARSDGVATIDVEDTGPGVRPEDAERIFLPFHSTKPLGAGLGLPMARSRRPSIACWR